MFTICGWNTLNSKSERIVALKKWKNSCYLLDEKVHLHPHFWSARSGKK